MTKTTVSPHELVDRLERKYERKIRFQKYKTITKQFRQKLSSLRGIPAEDLEEDSFDIFKFNDYEYTA